MSYVFHFSIIQNKISCKKKSSKTLDSLAHLPGKKWYVLYLRENAFLYLYNIYNIAHKCTCDTDMLYDSKELLGRLVLCKIFEIVDL